MQQFFPKQRQIKLIQNQQNIYGIGNASASIVNELINQSLSVVKKFKDSDIVVKKGRFNRGDYITDGKANVSIPKGINSEDITLDNAQELFNKKINA